MRPKIYCRPLFLFLFSLNRKPDQQAAKFSLDYSMPSIFSGNQRLALMLL